MKQTIMVAQLVTGILSIVLILLQAKGTGLGRTLGTTMYHSRRGVETLVFRSTIFLVISFVVLAIVSHFVLG